jgi:hypothetical protein
MRAEGGRKEIVYFIREQLVEGMVGSREGEKCLVEVGFGIVNSLLR